MRRALPVLSTLALAAIAAAAIAVAHDARPADAATGTVGAKAFARVISNGTFDATRSRNVTSITQISQGTYCINLSVTVKNPVASVNAVSAPALAEAGLVGGTLDGGITCPAGSDVFVRTFSVTATGPAPASVPFYVVAH